MRRQQVLEEQNATANGKHRLSSVAFEMTELGLESRTGSTDTSLIQNMMSVANEEKRHDQGGVLIHRYVRILLDIRAAYRGITMNESRVREEAWQCNGKWENHHLTSTTTTSVGSSSIRLHDVDVTTGSTNNQAGVIITSKSASKSIVISNLRGTSVVDKSREAIVNYQPCSSNVRTVPLSSPSSISTNVTLPFI